MLFRSREVAGFEPPLALFGGDDGLDVIGALLPAAAGALGPGGRLLMEIGFGQIDAVRALVDATAGLVFAGAREDLQGIPRVVIARKVD